MSVLSIRDFEPGDEEHFYGMAAAFYKSGAVYDTVNHDFFRKTFNECVSKSPYVRGIFICRDNVIGGYALLTFTYSNEYGGKIMEIDEIYIKEEYRKNGLAGCFMSAILSEYKNDISYVEAAVMEDNAAAISLCGKFGFISNNYLYMHKI
ncbi:MAG: GNAT family N-acetyltransferase [Defluviitaleaceae bacterium]|nr:GNAT family N-acetyltransferase [Defluviitaleaceae bacterium]MCL2836268.1 GNAT family N-acetyltransferase [Defluviitaleaceae bacterium]